MHHWGGDFKYFGEVGDAADEIGSFCRRWGRIPVTQTKEKYGTVRVYCTFGCSDLQGLLYPGYHYVQPLLGRRFASVIPERLNYAIMTFPFLRPFRSLIVRWQRAVYRMAYKRAITKYPMIREEILCVADWDEYLVGL